MGERQDESEGLPIKVTHASRSATAVGGVCVGVCVCGLRSELNSSKTHRPRHTDPAFCFELDSKRPKSILRVEPNLNSWLQSSSF